MQKKRHVTGLKTVRETAMAVQTMYRYFSGLHCPYGEKCCWGHVCPSGPKCFHLSKGKCWFKGGPSVLLPLPWITYANDVCITEAMHPSIKSVLEKTSP